MNSPRVSVLMTVYNGMPYLPEAVDSILTQTFTDYEFIIVNDGSTDGTVAYLGTLTDPRVRVLHRENGGTSAAANEGLGHCRGEYTARFDADDLSLPTRLEKQAAFLDAHPEVGLIGGQIAYIGTTGKAKPLKLPNDHDAIDAALLAGKHAIAHSNMMVRTELIKAVGGYGGLKYADDMEMILRIGELTRFANVDEVLLHYRMHTGSLNATGMRMMRHSIAYGCESARRRRSGRPAVSFEDFLAERRRRPWTTRAAEAVGVHARCQYRLAMAELCSGRTLRGYARLGWAALLAPRLTIERLLRVLSPRGRRAASG